MSGYFSLEEILYIVLSDLFIMFIEFLYSFKIESRVLKKISEQIKILKSKIS